MIPFSVGAATFSLHNPGHPPLTSLGYSHSLLIARKNYKAQ